MSDHLIDPHAEREMLTHRFENTAGNNAADTARHMRELLFGNGDRHVTAELLFQEARAKKHPPSFATIYNTLHQFAEHGLVREIALYGSKLWYDTKTGPHFHFYFEDQDELVDIPDDMIPLFSIAAPPGTEITGIDVVVRLKSRDCLPRTAN